MSESIKNINWYPGHMKKTRELIQENLKMVDLVIEVIDSRIPRSSRNPIIDELIQSKKRIIILHIKFLQIRKYQFQNIIPLQVRTIIFQKMK